MTSAVVPVKGLASSKSRLLPYLGRDAVERLAIAMLGDVVAALREVPTLSRVAVVTPDARVAKAAEQVGAEPLLRRYADLKGQSVDAMKAFADDVRSGAFPNHEESYHMADDEADELLGLYGSEG